MFEDQDTINELTGRIQELQNEVNCMNDSRDFKDAESVRSGLSHVPSKPAVLPPYRDPGGVLSRSVGMLSRQSTGVFFISLIQEGSIVGITRTRYLVYAWYIGKRPPASSSSPYPGLWFNPCDVRNVHGTHITCWKIRFKTEV